MFSLGTFQRIKKKKKKGLLCAFVCPSWFKETGETSQCPRVLGFKFLGFLGDGFGVKEKKNAGTGGMCPTVTGTH